MALRRGTGVVLICGFLFVNTIGYAQGPKKNQIRPSQPKVKSKIPQKQAGKPDVSVKSLLKASLEGPDTVKLGKPFELRVKVAYPKGYRVFLDKHPNLSPLVLVTAEKPKETVKNQQITRVFTYKCFASRLGDLEVKNIEVPYTTDKDEPRIESLKYKVNVTGELGNENEIILKAPGKPQPVWVVNRPLKIGLIAGGVALLAAILGAIGFAYYRRWREAHRPPPPPVPAHITALKRLKELEAKYPPQVENAKFIAFETSEVARWYLGRIFGFAGAELTTWEVLQMIHGIDMGRVTPVQVEDFLGFTDMVKFADFTPGPSEIAQMIQSAREIIQKVQQHYEVSKSTDTAA